MNSVGLDVSQSAAGRVALDAMLVPTAFLNPLINWSTSQDPGKAIAEWTIGPHTCQTELRMLRSVVMPRWGNPNGNAWGKYPCGGTLAGEVDFGGIKLPTKMQAGWFSRQTSGQKASSSGSISVTFCFSNSSLSASSSDVVVQRQTEE